MKSKLIIIVITLMVTTGCVWNRSRDDAAFAVMDSNGIIEYSDVLNLEGESVGKSNLHRFSNKLQVFPDGCCLIKGNAYTVLWAFGPVENDVPDSLISQGEGFVAESEEFELFFELETLNSDQGVRIIFLDHGPYTGDASQLSSSSGGCIETCPTVFTIEYPGN